MEEKIIIEAKAQHVKEISIILIIIGMVVGAFAVSEGLSDPFYARKSLEYKLTSAVPYFLSYSFLPFLIIAGIFFLIVSRIRITVSDKRVYGTAVFGKRVDLPLDMISAVGTSLLNGISVTTSSGSIKFLMVENAKEVYGAISELLLDRQARQQTSVKAEMSSADELKKYKELLDSGVISQEEFDAKKKQLLGL